MRKFKNERCRRVETNSVMIDVESLDERIATLVTQNGRLKELLNYERAQRIMAEQKVSELEAQLAKRTRHHKTPEEKEAEAVRALSKYKTNGVKKPSAVEEIKSYTDFHNMQEYMLSQGGEIGARNYLLLTLGVCIGCRVSDLVPLRFCNFFDDDWNYRERVMIYERKTSKINTCLITEAIKEAFNKFFEIVGRRFGFGDYIFQNPNTGNHITPNQGWRILDAAQKALGLPYNVGSHSMRKTFANVVACTDKTNIDMGTVEKVQGLLNHGDSRVTMRYLGALQRVYDNARMSVSDWVLGKSEVNELNIQSRKSIDDIYAYLETISEKIDEISS